MRRGSSYHDTTWDELLINGVEPVYGANKDNCYIDTEVKIGRGVKIWPNVILAGEGYIGEGSEIGHGVKLLNPRVGRNCVILGHVYDSIISEECYVGEKAEITRTFLGFGVKVKHECGIRDANIGRLTNIAEGVRIWNFDGVEKRKAKIGNRCFIGGGVRILGGFEIGNECYVAENSLVDQDVPDRTFFIHKTPGVRQATKKDNSAWYLNGNYLALKKSVGPEYRAKFLARAMQKCNHDQTVFEIWLKTPRRHIGGKTPLETIMKEGEPSFNCILEECGHNMPNPVI